MLARLRYMYVFVHVFRKEINLLLLESNKKREEKNLPLRRGSNQRPTLYHLSHEALREEWAKI